MSLTAASLSLTLAGIKALDAVSVGFAAGRVTAVLGPNGAGKSSLLSCLAGLRQPDTGVVRLAGIPRPALKPRDLARRVGFLPQSADVHWDIDVATLVGLGRFPWRGRWGETPVDIAAVAAAMAATDIGHLRCRIVNTLSGGERSRVLLARVLAGTPEWLLADEPLASLDPAHQLDGLDCLRSIAARGAGVVVVLHDLNQAARVADDVLLMRGGRIMAFGASKNVLTPALIGATYGVSVHAGVTPDGQQFLVTTGRNDVCS